MDRRGSVELLAFILILPLVLCPVLNTFHSYFDINKYDVLKQVTREALLRMEITGGLTSKDYDRVLNFLEEKNFDLNMVDINYTPYPVNFGDTVAFQINYTYEQIRYSLGLSGIIKTVTEEVMTYGPVQTTSKYYER